MRTTLALDDDVIMAARAIAARDRKTMGAVVSDLARQSLQRHSAPRGTSNGFPVLPRRGAVVTLELVNSLRDDEE